MNWYVKYEGTGEISGPMTQDEALSIVGKDGGDAADGLVFSENIFSPKFVTTPEVEGLLAEMKSVAEAGIVIPHVIQEVMMRAIDMIIFLSREKVVSGTIQGGVLDLDPIPEGVTVDIRDRDCDGIDENKLEKDDQGYYFQAG